MPRLRLAVALGMVMAVATTGIASAAVTRQHPDRRKVTGGTTQLALSSGAAGALSSGAITLSPIVPATASGSTFTFPITRGRLNPTTLRGRVVHSGGLTISNGTRTYILRRLTIVSDAQGITLRAAFRGSATRVCHRVGRHRRNLRCVSTHPSGTARIATVSGVAASGNSITGTADLTPFSADLLNRLAGKEIVTAGTALGTVTVSPTLS